MAMKSLSTLIPLGPVGLEPISGTIKPQSSFMSARSQHNGIRDLRSGRLANPNRKCSIQCSGDICLPSTVERTCYTSLHDVAEEQKMSEPAIVQRKCSLPHQQTQQQPHIRFQRSNDSKSDVARSLNTLTSRLSAKPNSPYDKKREQERKVMPQHSTTLRQMKETTNMTKTRGGSSSSANTNINRSTESSVSSSTTKGRKQMLQLYQESVTNVRKELKLLHQKVDRQLQILSMGQIPKEHRKRTAKAKVKSSA